MNSVQPNALPIPPPSPKAEQPPVSQEVQALASRIQQREKTIRDLHNQIAKAPQKVANRPPLGMMMQPSYHTHQEPTHPSGTVATLLGATNAILEFLQKDQTTSTSIPESIWNFLTKHAGAFVQSQIDDLQRTDPSNQKIAQLHALLSNIHGASGKSPDKLGHTLQAFRDALRLAKILPGDTESSQEIKLCVESIYQDIDHLKKQQSQAERMPNPENRTFLSEAALKTTISSLANNLSSAALFQHISGKAGIVNPNFDKATQAIIDANQLKNITSSPLYSNWQQWLNANPNSKAWLEKNPKWALWLQTDSKWKQWLRKNWSVELMLSEQIELTKMDSDHFPRWVNRLLNFVIRGFYVYVYYPLASNVVCPLLQEILTRAVTKLQDTIYKNEGLETTHQLLTELTSIIGNIASAYYELGHTSKSGTIAEGLETILQGKEANLGMSSSQLYDKIAGRFYEDFVKPHTFDLSAFFRHLCYSLDMHPIINVLARGFSLIVSIFLWPLSYFIISPLCHFIAKRTIASGTTLRSLVEKKEESTRTPGGYDHTLNVQLVELLNKILISLGDSFHPENNAQNKPETILSDKYKEDLETCVKVLVSTTQLYSYKTMEELKKFYRPDQEGGVVTLVKSLLNIKEKFPEMLTPLLTEGLAAVIGASLQALDQNRFKLYLHNLLQTENDKFYRKQVVSTEECKITADQVTRTVDDISLLVVHELAEKIIRGDNSAEAKKTEELRAKLIAWCSNISSARSHETLQLLRHEIQTATYLSKETRSFLLAQIYALPNQQNVQNWALAFQQALQNKNNMRPIKKEPIFGGKQFGVDGKLILSGHVTKLINATISILKNPKIQAYSIRKFLAKAVV